MADYFLFVDTETSGIPKSLQASVSDTTRWPYILQLAWLIYDRQGQLVKSANHYIFEEEISISKSSGRIHGITTTGLKSKGQERRKVIKLFAQDLRHYKPLVVGHFVEFDSKMLQVAFHRSGLKNILKDFRHFCTMKATSEYTLIPTQHFPKLGELYQKLFHERMEQQHDALVDATATARCFFELYRRGDFNDHRFSNQTLFNRVRYGVSERTGCGLPVLMFFIVLSIWLLL